MSYALENEAYRALPDYLERTYGITLHERIVRTEIDELEINFFARGEQNGEAVCLVGEAKLQLDERRENRRVVRDLIDQLDRQAAAASTLYPEHRMVRLIITHYARPAVLKQAQERGILVVQSFDWWQLHESSMQLLLFGLTIYERYVACCVSTHNTQHKRHEIPI